MIYTVIVEPSAEKELLKLDRQVSARLRPAIQHLASNPHPHGSTKLVGKALWRIRVGDWRVIYEVREKEVVVLVVRVGHRRDVYQ